jgi:ureidoglycolate dehydrogenase (NAD+)
MAYVPVNYDNPRYMPEPLRRFAQEAFERAGMAAVHAEELAGYLIATDLRGVLSHGTRSVPGYVQAFRTRHYNPAPVIRVAREAGAAMQFEGDGSVGHLVAARAMRGAVTRARQYGIGMATAVRCGHTGSIGNWTRIATGERMVGLFTSTAISLANFTAPRLITDAMGDPPFSMGFPGQPPVVIDMGTLLDRLENQEKIAAVSTLPLIKGMALQTISLMMTMPFAAMQPRPAEPYPGAICSLIAIAIDPAFFGPADAFFAEVRRLQESIQAMLPMPGLRRTVFPGEIEAEREADFRVNGVPLDPAHIEALDALGKELQIPPYWAKEA